MKKVLKLTLITILILGTIGAGAWFVLNRVNAKPLYEAHCDFVSNDAISTLTQDLMIEAQEYGDANRISAMQTIIRKIDTFENDLNAYLRLSNSKSKTSKKLSKQYSDLLKSRKSLVKNYNEYNERLGNSTNVESSESMIKGHHDSLFKATVNYVRLHNACFKKLSNYTFTHVYKGGSIKKEFYALYSGVVDDFLKDVKNDLNNPQSINYLNKNLNLDKDRCVIVLKSSETISELIGGEYSVYALKFKDHFANSNLSTLASNFKDYLQIDNIDQSSETSNEKLTVYYVKKLLGEA